MRLLCQTTLSAWSTETYQPANAEDKLKVSSEGTVWWRTKDSPAWWGLDNALQLAERAPALLETNKMYNCQKAKWFETGRIQSIYFWIVSWQLVIDKHKTHDLIKTVLLF